MKLCKYCVYWNEWTGVCCNGDSEYRADFRLDCDTCDKFSHTSKEKAVKANDDETPPVSDFDYVASILIEADKWGQLAEEAAELAQAALKMQRLSFFNTPRQTREECVKKVIEEHADLALCFKVLGWDDKEERKQIMEQKIHRWAEHLKSKEL